MKQPEWRISRQKLSVTVFANCDDEEQNQSINQSSINQS